MTDVTTRNPLFIDTGDGGTTEKKLVFAIKVIPTAANWTYTVKNQAEDHIIDKGFGATKDSVFTPMPHNMSRTDIKVTTLTNCELLIYYR